MPPTKTKSLPVSKRKYPNTFIRETGYDWAVINLILERNPALNGNRAGAIRKALEFWQKADPK